MAASLNEAAAQNLDLSTDIASDNNAAVAQTGEVARINVLNQSPNGEHILGTPPFSPGTLKDGHAYLFFTLDLPVTWNSNPALVATGARESLRFDPKLQLSTGFQMSDFQLSLQSTGDLDRYSSDSKADTNGFQSLVKFGLKSALTLSNACKEDVWGQEIAPYAMYQSSLKYTANFSALKADQNDVGGGVTFDSTFFGLPKPADGTICSSNKGSKLVDSYPQVGLDIQLTERYANTGPNSQSIYAKPSFTYNFSKEFATTLQPSFRVRWFDDFMGVSRRDETLILPAALAWDPDWLLENQKDGPFRGEIRLTMQFTRNWSNIPTKEARQWDVGPLLELVAIPVSGG
jgi:hypothetical protein